MQALSKSKARDIEVHCWPHAQWTWTLFPKTLILLRRKDEKWLIGAPAHDKSVRFQLTVKILEFLPEGSGPLGVAPTCIVRLRAVDKLRCCVMHDRRARSTFIKSGFPVAFSGSLHAVATGKLRLRVAPEMTGKMPVLLNQEIGRLESLPHVGNHVYPTASNIRVFAGGLGNRLFAKSGFPKFSHKD